MRIVSLVLRVKAEHIPTAESALQAVPGVEVHVRDFDNGQLIVTVEDGEGYSTADSLIAAHQAPFVMSATLAYEFNEEDNQEALSCQ